MRIDLYIHNAEPEPWVHRVENKLDAALSMLSSIRRQETKTMALIDDVLAEATRGTSVGQSVIALVQQLVTQSGGDPVKLQAALDAMRANDDAVAAAVLANTPSAPPV